MNDEEIVNKIKNNELHVLCTEIVNGLACGSINDDFDVIVEVLKLLGINPNAPSGTAKHRYENYTTMMDTALPIFQEEQHSVRHDYPHLPCGIFQHIRNTEPK